MNVQVSTVIMMVLLGAVALVGIGLSVMLKENDREGLVGEYGEAYSTFFEDGITLNRIKKTTFFVPAYSTELPLQEFKYSFNGESSDLPSAEPSSYQWTALIEPVQAYQLQATVDGVVQQQKLTMDTLRPQNLIRVPFACNLDFNQGGKCPRDWLEKECVSLAGTDKATFIHDPAVPNCEANGVVCGDCQWVLYLKARCEYVTWDNGQKIWTLLPNGLNAPGGVPWNHSRGFKYPYTIQDHEYEFEAVAKVNLTVRPLGDPLGVAQNISEGSMDFGQTAEDQRTEGLIMVITGSASIVVCGVALCCVRFMAERLKKRAKERAMNKAGGENGAAQDDSGDPMLQRQQQNDDRWSQHNNQQGGPPPPRRGSRQGSNSGGSGGPGGPGSPNGNNNGVYNNGGGPQTNSGTGSNSGRNSGSGQQWSQGQQGSPQGQQYQNPGNPWQNPNQRRGSGGPNSSPMRGRQGMQAPPPGGYNNNMGGQDGDFRASSGPQQGVGYHRQQLQNMMQSGPGGRPPSQGSNTGSRTSKNGFVAGNLARAPAPPPPPKVYGGAMPRPNEHSGGQIGGMQRGPDIRYDTHDSAAQNANRQQQRQQFSGPNTGGGAGGRNPYQGQQPRGRNYDPDL